MKKFLITLVTLFVFSVMGSGTTANVGSSPSVYVVMSSKAYAYHSTPYCSGLRNAKHPIKEVSLEKAVKEMNRRPCKICCH